MIVSDVRTGEEDGVQVLRAQVTYESFRDASFECRFRVRGAEVPLTPRADAFLAGFFAPCMFMRERLRIEGAVGTELITAVRERVGPQLRSWHRDLAEVEIECERTVAAAPDASKGRACLFSGGLDSWHSTLANADRIDHLLLIQGYDIRTRNEELWRSMVELGHQAGEALGKSLLTVATNLNRVAYREMRRLAWRAGRYKADFMNRCYQGSFLVASGLAVRDSLRGLVVPASWGPEVLHPYGTPWGTHPDLDPLWSNAEYEVEHHGCDTRRVDKIPYVRDRHPDAIRKLRVCNENLPGVYNCCRCDKCLRVMMELRAMGVLDLAEGFHEPLDLERVKRMHLLHPLVSVVAEAEARGDTELVAAVHTAQSRWNPGRWQANVLRSVQRASWHRLGRAIRRRWAEARGGPIQPRKS